MTEQSLNQNPNYEQIIAFLLKPLLAEPAELRIDCEYLPAHARVWVRVAFQPGDRERLLDGSSRHLYAVKTVLAAAARIAGQSVYLDIYGSAVRSRPSGERPERSSRGVSKGGNYPRRPERPTPAIDK
jgi:predicted RNA-binding protein YlqC (UPF0109 family)